MAPCSWLGRTATAASRRFLPAPHAVGITAMSATADVSEVAVGSGRTCEIGSCSHGAALSALVEGEV